MNRCRLSWGLGLILTAISLAATTHDYRQLGAPVGNRYASGTYATSGPVRDFARAPDGSILFASDTLAQYVETFRHFIPLEVEKLTDHGFSALAIGRDGRVWVGAAHDLGYVETETTGRRRFVSLKEQFHTGAGLAPRGFIAIAVAGSRVWFVDTTSAHEWDGHRFTTHSLDPARRVKVLMRTNSHCWIWAPERGVLALTAAGLTPLLPASALPHEPVWLLPPSNGAVPSQASAHLPDGWLAGTSVGAFVARGGKWDTFESASTLLQSGKATCAMVLADGNFVVGTLNNGVVMLSRDGELLYQFDHDAALNDNHVLTLWSDLPGEIWVGTTTGSARLLLPQFASTFLTRSTRGGAAPRSLALFNGHVFASTPLGVYQVSPGTSPNQPAQLAPLPLAPAPIWTLCTIDGLLVGGGVGGFWTWNGQQWSPIASLDGTVLQSANSREGSARAYFFTESALHSLFRQNGEWKVSTLDPDLGDRPLSLVETDTGDLLVSTMSGKVLRFGIHLQNDGNITGQRIAVFSPGAELPEETKRPRLALVGDQVIAYSESGFHYLDEREKRFRPVVEMANFRGIAVASSPDRRDAFWLVDTGPNTITGILRTTARPGAALHLTPLSAQPPFSSARLDQTEILLQATPEGSVLWVPTTNGMYRFGHAALTEVQPPGPVQLSGAGWSANPIETRPTLRGFEDRERAFERLPLRAGERVRIPPTAQALRFQFAQTPGLRRDRLETRLLSIENEWTVAFPIREFGKLAPGNYELQARAVDEFRRFGPVLSYPFEILAPWYRRGAAWFAYAVLLGLAIWGGVRWRVRQLERQNANLNRVVEERTRELALANAQKTDFLASISHEIRNPLNGITGLVDLLSSANLGPRERQLAQSLSACAKSLRRVFDEVLGFTRLEQGSISVQANPFSVSAILSETRDLFAAEATQRHVRLGVQASVEHDLLVGDDSKIRTIVNNFIANALKYAPGAPIEVTANTELTHEGRVTLTIEVRDHGPGIPPDEQELIFRKFVRGSAASAQREPGAGLGLATCQALAQLMGGSIGVESPVATAVSSPGATFFLRLELIRTAQTPSAASATAVPASIGQGGRALIVEDQEYNQLVARSIAERLGFLADVAGDARRAHDLFSANDFDLILLDWDVPGAKGDQLATEIRQTPRGAQPIIIALTAHDTEDIKRRCLASGMDAFLVKPLEPVELSRIIDEVRASRQRKLAPSATDFSVFDYLGHSDAQRTRQSAEEYLRQLDNEFAALQHAQQSGDIPAIARIAHRLRAHAAVVRCEPVVAAARDLQQRATSESTPDRAIDLSVIASGVARLRQELQAYLATPAP